MFKSANLPAWLVSELVNRGETVVVRSETPDEFAARMLSEQSIVWDAASQCWIEA